MIKSLDTEDSKLTMGQKIVDRILNNLKITISNVYFRFEDKLLLQPGCGITATQERYMIGVKLKSFTVRTCDQDYKEVADAIKVKETGERKKLSYKTVNIEDFSIFCDWQDIDNPENGSIDVAKLEEQHKESNTEYF